jgi:hypothetical protein
VTYPSHDRRTDRRKVNEELVFQMSSEAHRRSAIDAIDALYAPGIRAIPVERDSTAENLLLVIVVDDNYLRRAISAVLSVDPQARHPQSG